MNRKIFSASVSIAALTLAVGAFSLVKELIVAYRFGTSAELDAFLIAFLLPSFAVGVLGNSFPSAFIPVYMDVHESKGEKEAGKLFSSVFFWFAALLVLLMLIISFSFPVLIPFVFTGFDHETVMLTEKLFVLMLPILFFSALSKYFAGVLNAKENFALSGISPVFMPLLGAAFLIIFEPYLGIFSLAYGVVAGAFLEFLLLCAGLKKKKFSLKPVPSGFTPELRQIVFSYSPLIFGFIMTNSMVLVDQSMAAMLEEGSVASYNFGNRIVAFLLGLVSVSFGAAVFPYVSRMAAKKDRQGIENTFRIFKRVMIFGGGLASLALFAFSRELTSFIYQRGEFTAEDTLTVSLVLAFISLQIPFYAGQILLFRLIASFKANKILMRVSGISLILNIILNYVFMNLYGVAGIALSTSVVACVVYYALNHALARKVGRDFSAIGKAYEKNGIHR